MPHDLEITLALLARTPATLDALLRDLPTAWTAYNEGGNTWNVSEVVGHLVYSEQVNWLPRLKQILDSGINFPFEPFDRLGHLSASAGKSLNELLKDFAALRAQNIVEIRALNLQPQQLELRGIHPTFGEVTMSELLATQVVHDLTHLTQISRVMAHQYRETVGPWQQFLGVLHRNPKPES